MNTKGVAFLTIAATLAAISVTVFLIEWESSPLIILFVVLGLLAIVSNLILVSKLFAMYQKSKRQVQSVLYEKSAWQMQWKISGKKCSNKTCSYPNLK